MTIRNYDASAFGLSYSTPTAGAVVVDPSLRERVVAMMLENGGFNVGNADLIVNYINGETADANAPDNREAFDAIFAHQASDSERISALTQRVEALESNYSSRSRLVAAALKFYDNYSTTANLDPVKTSTAHAHDPSIYDLNCPSCNFSSNPDDYPPGTKFSGANEPAIEPIISEATGGNVPTSPGD